MRNTAAGLLGAAGTREAAAQAQAARATPGHAIAEDQRYQVIATAPAGLRLTVVKITTDQDGLYGYGCARIRSAPTWSMRRWRNTCGRS